MLYINYFIPVIMFGKSNYASIPATIPGNSNYASISKDGRKIFVVGDSYVKRIRRIDFNKELRNNKVYFRSFSGATSKQLDHYTKPLLFHDKPDAAIICIGNNQILVKKSNVKCTYQMCK